MGEASLFGHLKNGADEEKGSDAYVPPDRDKDTQLVAAVELLHGAKPETLKSPEVTSQ
jgi:carboxyl-terminal processing protease